MYSVNSNLHVFGNLEKILTLPLCHYSVPLTRLVWESLVSSSQMPVATFLKLRWKDQFRPGQGRGLELKLTWKIGAVLIRLRLLHSARDLQNHVIEKQAALE